jgi:hypothetical protein
MAKAINTARKIMKLRAPPLFTDELKDPAITNVFRHWRSLICTGKAAGRWHKENDDAHTDSPTATVREHHRPDQATAAAAFAAMETRR